MIGTNALGIAIVATLITISVIGGFYAGIYYASFQHTSTLTSAQFTTTTQINETTVGSLTYQLLPAISVVNFTIFNSSTCPTTCFDIMLKNFGKLISAGSWKLFFHDLTHSKATEYLCNSTQSIVNNGTFDCSGTLDRSFRTGDTLNVQVVAPNGAKAIGRVQQLPGLSTNATTTTT